jgi:hypothetical protein
VCLVAQPLGFGKGKLAFVNTGRDQSRCCWCQRRRYWRPLLCLHVITAKELGGRALVSPPVIVRWPWNRSRIVRMQTKTRRIVRTWECWL